MVIKDEKKKDFLGVAIYKKPKVKKSNQMSHIFKKKA
jgi:hypothetical protein